MTDLDDPALAGALMRLAAAMVPDDEVIAHEAAVAQLISATPADDGDADPHGQADRPRRRWLVLVAASLLLTLCALGLFALAAAREHDDDRSVTQSPTAATDDAAPPWAGGVGMIVYVSPNASPSQVEVIRQALLSHPDIVDAARLRYLDADEALAEAAVLLADDPETLAVVSETNLPTQFKVFPTAGRESDLATLKPSMELVAGVYRVVLPFDEPVLVDPASDTSAAATTTSLSAPETVVDTLAGQSLAPLSELAVDSWVIPTYLPDGTVFHHAIIQGDGSRRAIFTNVARDTGIFVAVKPDGTTDEVGITDPVPTVIDGTVWMAGELGSELQMFAREVNGSVVMVSSGFDDAESVRVIEGLRVGDESLFPLPPIDTSDRDSFVVAARTELGGEVVELKVASDGHFYCVELSGGAGSCIGDLDGIVITPTAAELRTDGSAVAYGAVTADVASVQIHLSDGRIVTTDPQDINDAFPANFYLVAGPYPSGGMSVVRVVALDAAGNELGTATP